MAVLLATRPVPEEPSSGACLPATGGARENCAHPRPGMDARAVPGEGVGSRDTGRGLWGLRRGGCRRGARGGPPGQR